MCSLSMQVSSSVGAVSQPFNWQFRIFDGVDFVSQLLNMEAHNLNILKFGLEFV